MEVDENSENKLETAGWKGSVELLTPLGSPTREPQWVTGGYQLDRSETTTGICPATSGTTSILFVRGVPGWILMSLLNIASSIKIQLISPYNTFLENP